MKHLRIVLYSHDSLGLGHVRRNLALANALNNQLPGLMGKKVAGILVAGTDLAPGFHIPFGWDWVILPGVDKAFDDYRPRNLAVPMRELVSLRGALLETLLHDFHPDLVVVDRHATGIHGELEAALRRIRALGHARVVLGLREVLDAPEAAIAEWDSIGGARRVEELFDAVWIYGDRAIHDPVAAGEVPSALRNIVSYTGYLAAGRPPGSGKLGEPGRYFMTTVGGGADGHALAKMASETALPAGFGHLIVAGPQMPKPQLQDLLRHARPNVRVVQTVDDMVLHIRHAEAVVSMGGYNSVCEIMSTDVPALIVPRNHSRSEQKIRAASLAAAGYVEDHDIATLTPQILADWLAHRVGTTVDRRGAQLDGLVRVPQLAANLILAADRLQPIQKPVKRPPLRLGAGVAHVAV